MATVIDIYGVSWKLHVGTSPTLTYLHPQFGTLQYAARPDQVWECNNVNTLHLVEHGSLPPNVLPDEVCVRPKYDADYEVRCYETAAKQAACADPCCECLYAPLVRIWCGSNYQDFFDVAACRIYSGTHYDGAFADGGPIYERCVSAFGNIYCEVFTCRDGVWWTTFWCNDGVDDTICYQLPNLDTPKCPGYTGGGQFNQNDECCPCEPAVVPSCCSDVETPATVTCVLTSATIAELNTTLVLTKGGASNYGGSIAAAPCGPIDVTVQCSGAGLWTAAIQIGPVFSAEVTQEMPCVDPFYLFFTDLLVTGQSNCMDTAYGVAASIGSSVCNIEITE